MKYVISRYNHNLSWLADYTSDYILYDRSETPLAGAIIVPNVGSDLYDKLTFIIENYSNLPDVAVYTKANLFDYITPKEFNEIKDNKTFTPILTQKHREIMCSQDMQDNLNCGPKAFSYYKNGMYYELNYPSYLKVYPTKGQSPDLTLDWYYNLELTKMLGLDKLEYVPFAPGSNYILPKENILKHPKEFYEKLRSFIDWAVYPGEAQIIERGLYLLWK